MSLTHQEIFDRVWKHAIIDEQPFSATLRDDKQCPIRCEYGTTAGGPRCFVGIFDTEDKLHGLVAPVGRIVPDDIPEDLQEACANFLEDLQSAHDNAAISGGRNGRYLQDVKCTLSQLGRNWSLEVPE